VLSSGCYKETCFSTVKCFKLEATSEKLYELSTKKTLFTDNKVEKTFLSTLNEPTTIKTSLKSDILTEKTFFTTSINSISSVNTKEITSIKPTTIMSAIKRVKMSSILKIFNDVVLADKFATNKKNFEYYLNK